MVVCKLGVVGYFPVYHLIFRIIAVEYVPLIQT